MRMASIGFRARTSPWQGLAVCVAATALASGCGGSEPAALPVAGSVRHREQVVPTGTITCVSESGTSQSAPIQPDGSFQLQLPAGRYRVGIRAARPRPEGMTAAEEFAYVSKEPPYVPLRYNDPARSGLYLDVFDDGQENVVEFNLP